MRFEQITQRIGGDRRGRLLRACFFALAIASAGATEAAVTCHEGGDDFNGPAEWTYPNNPYNSCGGDTGFYDSGAQAIIVVNLEDTWGVYGEQVDLTGYRLIYFVVMERHRAESQYDVAFVAGAGPTDIESRAASIGPIGVNLYSNLIAVQVIGVAGKCPSSITTDYACAVWAYDHGVSYYHTEPRLCIPNPGVTDVCDDLMNDDLLPRSW